jgi:hypothetical protein
MGEVRAVVVVAAEAEADSAAVATALQLQHPLQVMMVSPVLVAFTERLIIARAILEVIQVEIREGIMTATRAADFIRPLRQRLSIQLQHLRQFLHLFIQHPRLHLLRSQAGITVAATQDFPEGITMATRAADIIQHPHQRPFQYQCIQHLHRLHSLVEIMAVIMTDFLVLAEFTERLTMVRAFQVVDIIQPLRQHPFQYQCIQHRLHSLVEIMAVIMTDFLVLVAFTERLTTCLTASLSDTRMAQAIRTDMMVTAIL